MDLPKVCRILGKVPTWKTGRQMFVRQSRLAADVLVRQVYAEETGVHYP